MVGVMDVPVRDTAAYRNHPLAMVAYATQANDIHQNMSRRESNAGHFGAFLGRRAAHQPISARDNSVRSYARSVFDPDAPDRLPISLDGLALYRCCESGADQAGQRAACKAVGEHDHFGRTKRTAGEQLECPTLFRVDATLSGGNTVIHGRLYDMCRKCRARLAG
jgi:hypothetical protein